MATSKGSSEGPGEYLAVIPARGGSKRLPRKNLLPLGGRPLIEWTLRAALACRRLSQAVVSTDDPGIAAAAEAAGLPPPFMRPPHLASDTAGSVDVALHALAWYRERGRTFRRVVLLQPTSPLRTAADIEAALDLLESRGADAVVSVCEAEHSPLWCNTLPPDLSLEGFLRSDVLGKRSQDLPRHYRLNGAIYIADAEALAREGAFLLRRNAYAYVMPKERSVDIDDGTDFRIAEALLQDAMR